MATPVSISSNRTQGCHFPHILQHLLSVFVFMIAILNMGEINLIVVLFCISLMISDVRYFYVLFTISMSPWNTAYSDLMSICRLHCLFFSFLLLSCMHLYIYFGYKPLIRYYSYLILFLVFFFNFHFEIAIAVSYWLPERRPYRITECEDGSAVQQTEKWRHESQILDWSLPTGLWVVTSAVLASGLTEKDCISQWLEWEKIGHI